MRLLVSWLKDFVAIDAPAEEIAERVGLRGFEVASIEPVDNPGGGPDAVIDFEVTANRPDCLSVLGLAREVATIYHLPIAPLDLKPLDVGRSSELSVTIDEPDLCPRYAAAVAEVSVGASPAWMSRRLQAAGIRSINSIVDLTNYVLMEIGHPTHAFDLAHLAAAEIWVRRGRTGEAIATLDGVQRTVDTEMLVIADRDRPQAIAGVMGGAGSEVSSGTRRVVFESAYFKPASVRRTSKRLNLKTEASSRFERGADINAPIVALQRMAALLDRVGDGRLILPAVDAYPGPRQPERLHLRRSRLASLLGVAVPDADVMRILQSLGLAVTASPDGWHAVVPTFRVDLLREVDLIEEVGRHFGFDQLPATFPVVTAPAPAPDRRVGRDKLVRRVLTGAGLSEAVTFGFVEAKAARAFATHGSQAAIAIANPLSAKFDTLRPLLLPGLVDAVAHNRRHGRDDVRLFEIGTRFAAEGETRAVGVAWTGAATPIHWSGTGRAVDFFDVKGVIDTLARALDAPVRFEPADEPFLVPGEGAVIVCAGGPTDGLPVGLAGQIAPQVADARGLPRQDRVYAAELNLDRLERARATAFDATHPLPRFPFVVRDLSIIVASTLPAEIIRGTIQAAGHGGAAPLTAIAFFDRYQGKGVPDGTISISVRLTFQALDRTLTDAEIQDSVDKIMAALVHAHRAVRR